MPAPYWTPKADRLAAVIDAELAAEIAGADDAPDAAELAEEADEEIGPVECPACGFAECAAWLLDGIACAPTEPAPAPAREELVPWAITFRHHPRAHTVQRWVRFYPAGLTAADVMFKACRLLEREVIGGAHRIRVERVAEAV